jgi:hypothetical protein
MVAIQELKEATASGVAEVTERSCKVETIRDFSRELWSPSPVQPELSDPKCRA